MITISETTARTVRELLRERIDDAYQRHDFEEFHSYHWANTIIEYVLSDNYECLREFLKGE